MFTIVISEKGGGERRETFEKTEISVGRVQGNDLMLPKGNVSKHHARLLSRDGRFIVTDLKSTNGTYVNGRRTSQATIVREGDKIYIGDFVLRLETGQGAANAPDAGGRASAPGEGGLAMDAEGQAGTPPHAYGSIPPARPPEVSHFPLERDPDSESAPALVGAAQPQVPSAPRAPQSAGLRSRSVAPPPPPLPGRPVAVPTPRAPSPSQVSARVPSFGDGLGRHEPRRPPGRRVALITLVDRIADVVDLSPLDRSPDVDPTLKEQIERAAREQAKAMRSEGEVPGSMDLDQLAVDATRELVSLGPVGVALEDEDVSEIHVTRSDSMIVKRKGERALLADVAFTSEEAVARVVARLAQQSGERLGAGEALVERRLPSGARLIAIGPPAAASWAFTIRKRRRLEGEIDELLRTSALSRPMADFLFACVRGRVNLLIVGSESTATGILLSALASAASEVERLAVFQEDDEIGLGDTQALPLSSGPGASQPERLAAAALRLGADRLVVPSLASAVGLASLDAVAQGADGVLAGYAGATLRRGLSRLSAWLSWARPGIAAPTAREIIAASFEIGVEVGRDASGALRIRRITELGVSESNEWALRDVFALNVEGGPASFSATGSTPRVAQDLALRGVQLDPAIFARPK